MEQNYQAFQIQGGHDRLIKFLERQLMTLFEYDSNDAYIQIPLYLDKIVS